MWISHAQATWLTPTSLQKYKNIKKIIISLLKFAESSSAQVLLFQFTIFLIAYSFQPLVGCVLARYFKSEVGKPAVFCCTMPMLHISRYVDNGARENLLRRFPFFLIPATSSYTYQHLPTALCGVVYVPVVTAPRLKGNIKERNLTVGYFRQITVAFKVFGISGVRFANREYHFALKGSLGIFAFYIFAPYFLCQIECSPSFRPASVKGDMDNNQSIQSILLQHVSVLQVHPRQQ